MLFAIHALDKKNSGSLRADAAQEHGAFLGNAAAWGLEIVFSGPLVDANSPIGSLLVVEAQEIGIAKKFIEADPLAKAGVYEKVSVTGFLKKRG
ncbi:YciI family protein [Polaromonas sp. JS666]|uniref:YciI family protein n=1 Tax=Polaromonas sp. (strain JS666 / ATCC BAA-500) TaxID=296591 RepID=UPI0000464D98|nr:YciI family protein [Polaromonas sp. JS666]ABE42313.1 YCII-related protein [Polaromonas sp. JS666]